MTWHGCPVNGLKVDHVHVVVISTDITCHHGHPSSMRVYTSANAVCICRHSSLYQRPSSVELILVDHH